MHRIKKGFEMKLSKVKSSRSNAYIFYWIVIFISLSSISQDKFITMESCEFPGGHKEDGMWTAISAASACGNFIIYDIDSGKTIGKGRVNNRGTVCRSMVIDAEENCFTRIVIYV